MTHEVQTADPTRGAWLNRVRVVLVETSHPGNIGASARAMKAMGFRRLALISPREFPSAAATARASGADDVLMNASHHAHLGEAIADCGIVIGTTARTRHLEWPVMTPRELATWIVAQPPETEIALVFGREQSGLSNEELALCHRVVRIPTDRDFTSLNLGQAVQILTYELALIAPADDIPNVDAEPLATALELDNALAHALAVMERIDFYHPERPKLLPLRVQRLLNRSGLKRSEVRILRGFLTAIEKSLPAE